ncbi:nose resistant to fluoxetine protein 6-like [Maniola hyperantus]|uniref:nose resistant to fluoxetine protein 6-like n=1 Tax=Aphantopus hyperantus TaxID=2795564 RepID=UPI00156A1501|nr:nose resistant to fluoxetine protein 6-like [Maniola hyperantus]
MKNILLLVLTIICSKTCAKLYLDGNIKFPLDTDLFERVLDSQECQRQLEYIRQNNTILRAEFLDAGMRVPRGILQGNLVDLGNYLQCLGIHENVNDMSIEGKFCMIRVPMNQNVQLETSSVKKSNFDPGELRLDSRTIKKLVEYNSNIKKLRSTFGGEFADFRRDQESPLSGLQFNLALCVPKVCTTEEAITGLLFNLTAVGFEYEDSYCRLPNDKPWAPVDYIAVIIFSILGILTVLSTSYDVYYNIICKKDPKKTNEIFISFSALTNCRRLLAIKTDPNNIQCLDGIRSLAIFWVIVGHVFFIISFIPANVIYSVEWSQQYESIWVMTATLTVDTFFLLSGLLLVFISAKKLTGRQLIRNLPFFYLNRLLRMFPVLAAVVLYEASFSNRIADGPLWPAFMFNNVHKCRNFWWTTLLHLQNFINPREACLGVTWYLAIDVQLHILSPIVLFWVLGRSRATAWTAVTTAVVASLAASTIYIFTKEALEDNHYVYYYVNILTRAPTFFVGLVYGYLLHVWRNRKPKMHLVFHSFITTFFILLLLLIIYCQFIGGRNDFDNRLIKRLFDSFLRPLWALCLGWIIFACVNGYGGPINWFLSLNIWKIPARISYAMYLTHMSIMFAVYSTTLQPVYFTLGSAMFDVFGFLWLTMFVSFFLTALIDAPFAILFKKLFEYVSKKPNSNKRTTIEKTKQNGNVQIPFQNGNIVTNM